MKDNILCFYCVFVSPLGRTSSFITQSDTVHPGATTLQLYCYYYRVGGTSLHLVLGHSVGRAVATSEAVGGGYGRPERFAPHLHVWPCGHHRVTQNCQLKQNNQTLQSLTPLARSNLNEILKLMRV